MMAESMVSGALGKARAMRSAAAAYAFSTLSRHLFASHHPPSDPKAASRSQSMVRMLLRRAGASELRELLVTAAAAGMSKESIEGTLVAASCGDDALLRRARELCAAVLGH